MRGLLCTLILTLAGLGLGGCADETGNGKAGPAVASVRAARRAYDGAPPVIPHPLQSSPCTACHGRQGMQVPDLGYAPPSPHAFTSGVGETARCRQCHVLKHTEESFVSSSFAGLRQDLRRGHRQHPLAPPVMPHPVFMRENCLACHSGPAAREEIRCTHPERTRCTQCHVEPKAAEPFSRDF